MEGQSQNGKTASANPPLLEYSVGAIVWAKIRGSPLWPSIICCDPTNNLYYKYSAEKQTVTYHVRFCNYYGQRGWSLSVEQFCTKAELIAKHPKFLIGLKKNVAEGRLWAGAVKEANELMKLQRNERSILFCTTYELNYEDFTTKDPAEIAQENNLPSTSSCSNAYNKEPVQEFKKDYSKKVYEQHAQENNLPSTSSCSNIYNKEPVQESKKDDSKIGDEQQYEMPDPKRLYTLEEQKQLVIDVYGYSNPPEGLSSEEDLPEEDSPVKLDLDNLIPVGDYRVPEDLVARICEFEERRVIEQAEAKRQLERDLAAKAARKKASKPRSTSTPGVAAKRGRKPKSQLEPELDTKPVVKRGRKPKSQLQPGLVTEEGSDEKSQLEPELFKKPAAKRGRKPKNLLEEPGLVTEEGSEAKSLLEEPGLVSDGSDEKSQLEPELVTKPVVKRGRQPKSQLKCELSTEEAAGKSCEK